LLVAGLVLVVEERRMRRQLGINNMWRLIEAWDHPDMRYLRATMAQRVLANPEIRRELTGDELDVLNTFELVAYLVVRSKTLGLDHAWINFSAWAVSWWYVWEEGIKLLRGRDPTVFEDYTTLVSELLKYEARARKKPLGEIVPTQQDLTNFLGEEVDLLTRIRSYERAAESAREGDDGGRS
jgi:hypothetical protein